MGFVSDSVEMCVGFRVFWIRIEGGENLGFNGLNKDIQNSYCECLSWFLKFHVFI